MTKFLKVYLIKKMLNLILIFWENKLIKYQKKKRKDGEIDYLLKILIIQIIFYIFNFIIYKFNI